MTPITSPAVARVLPPTVPYAAGLVCEHRPDLADGVREVVLGEDAVDSLAALALARAEHQDQQGARALAYLREIIDQAVNNRAALHSLAHVLHLLPGGTSNFWNSGTAWWRQTNQEAWSKISWSHDDMIFESPPASVTMFGHLPIGHAYCRTNGAWCVSGLPQAHFQNQWMALRGSRVVGRYLHEGFAVVWSASKSNGAREALRRLIPIHAHTVSLDATVRDAWTQAHLDALL